MENPVYLCDLVASLVQSADTKELQQILDTVNVRGNFWIFSFEFLNINEKIYSSLLCSDLIFFSNLVRVSLI